MNYTKLPFLVLVWALLSTPPLAGELCEPPPDLVLAAGESLRLGDAAFEVATSWVDSEASSGSQPEPRMAVDLMVRWVDPVARGPRGGSYVPGLSVRYALSAGGRSVGEGKLEMRLAERGAAYGATLALPQEHLQGRLQGSLDDELLLTVFLDVREDYLNGAASHTLGRVAGACPRLPIELRAILDVSGGPAPETASAAETASPGDDIRLTLLGSFDPRPSENYSDVWGYDGGAVQLAIIGTTNGTLFIDVTNPANPVELADIPGPPSSWRDIKTFQNYAYMVTEGGGSGFGVQIVNLANLQNIQLVSTYTQTLTTAHNIYIDEASGQAWVVGTNNGTRILRLIPNPVSPTEIGSWSVRYVHDAYVADGYAYLSEINSGFQEILDSTDPANLQSLSTWITPDAKSHNSWANDDHTLLATTDEVTGGHVAVYDITDKNGPVPLLGEYDPNPSAIVHNVMFDDDDNERIVISHYALGGKYVDLHRPSMPVVLGSYDTRPETDNGGSGAWGVYPFDPRGYIYISDIQTGLYVLRYDPTGGTLSGVITDAESGEPLRGARVQVINDLTEVTSGTDGVYAIYATKGVQQLRVSALGYETQIVAAGTLPVDARLDADVALVPLARTTLTGTVRDAVTKLGIGGATLEIDGATLAATTSVDGTFQIAEVPVGQQVVLADAPGYAPRDVRIVARRGQPGVLVVDLEPGIFADTAETDQGWTLGAPGDTALTGVWERVDPNGTGGGAVQPEDDHTADPGALAFITGQSSPGATTEDNDVEGGATTLVSPSFDATQLAAARLRYHRWVSTDAGAVVPGGLLEVEVSSDGGSNWTFVELVGSDANSWVRRDVELGSLVPLTSQNRIRFRAEQTFGFDTLKVVECGVDDVDVVSGCRSRFSPELADADLDGLVDVCDICLLDSSNDIDGDGLCGEADNAPFVANAMQQDADADGVGDVSDNCDTEANADQRDLDGDGLGDACDSDVDGDGMPNGADADDDADGVTDGLDLCPTVADPLQIDRDTDGTGDLCDPDDGLVQGLRLGEDRLFWEPESGSTSYAIYRGDLGAEGLLPLAVCRIDTVFTTFFDDAVLPGPGNGFFYLVARNVGAAEGPLGDKSNGTPREVSSPCP